MPAWTRCAISRGRSRYCTGVKVGDSADRMARISINDLGDVLIVVALVNKLVSLANHPSTRILQKTLVVAQVCREKACPTFLGVATVILSIQNRKGKWFVGLGPAMH